MGGKPKAPPPPDPRQTSAAATSTNVGTSVANAIFNNTNQITPQGEVRYDQTNTFDWHDPYTNVTYQLPQFTATQILSDQQRAINAQNEAAQYNMAGMANYQSSRLGQHLASDIDLSNMPAAGDPGSLSQYAGGAQGAPETRFPLQMSLAQGGPIQNSLGDLGQIQSGLGDYGQVQQEFGQAGDITRDYGPQDDFSSDRQRVEDALMGRLNPQLSQERSRIENQLAQKGIRAGSTAYNAAFDPYNRMATDARFAAIGAGGQEQQRMTDMAAQRAGFQNAAQMQDYQQQFGRGTFANQAQQQMFGQALGAGQFANQAQQQQYGQALGAGEFANAAQAQGFQQEATRGAFANAAQQTATGEEMARAAFNNSALQQNFGMQQGIISAQDTSRQNALNEAYQARNQPINEISALMSGSQVSQPNFLNVARNQIPTTDVGGLINKSFDQRMDIYKQESANYNAMMGGLMGMAGGMMKMSDERVKQDVVPMGRVFGLPIYEFSYKGDPQHRRDVGPMAQDVEKIDKRAVKNIGGIKHINMAKMGSVLGKAASHAN